ncbi:MAG: hypothetical protein E6H09_11980 [Bacteroidetes bacterium]|nr:MAG: hypothetical protein E6H09_11980 [Bacteroidota bacterium]
MIPALSRYLIVSLVLLACQSTIAQGPSLPDTAKIPADYKPEFNRLRNHELIDAEQTGILNSDGKADRFFIPTVNDEVNFLLTQALTKQVDLLQYDIETDSVFDHRLKVNYLKGLENILHYYRQNWKNRSDKKLDPVYLPSILLAYRECVARDRTNESIDTVVNQLPYEAGAALMTAGIFDKNPGFRPARISLIYKYCILYPQQIFSVLRENPDVPFAESLIRSVARTYPQQLYDYAQANNKLGTIIRTIHDDVFISSVVRMASSKSGQQYFPFLDNIVKGKMTFEGVDSVMNDSLLYYRLLVSTQLDYTERMLNGDTAFAYKELLAKIQKRAGEVFATTINGLHEKPDEVRFKCIQPLTAEELYYVAVSTDGLIYTSSYTRGVYPLMMKKINGKADSLLISVHFDHYRKFISQAAAYNTLGEFLSSFPHPSDADDLMKAFVSKLEKADGLEDGVDVADSYASIAETLKPRAAEMLKNVQQNYKRNIAENNPKGIAIYNILNKLFLSADSTKKINLTKELGIPPVYNVPFNSLVNDSGEVVIQLFFYGDDDGKMDYSIFLNMFKDKNWKINKTDTQWVVIKSVKGKHVSLYANIPLDEETSGDERAQKALGYYLEANNIHPTITINRGHSYHAETTIKYMSPNSRIVFMGSCGGFHLIDLILRKTPDAHIIASKQIGKRDINKPFLQLLTDKLRAGSNIDWIPFWREFKKKADKEGFEDYIPPYKNLGAIFIKAYRIAIENSTI